MTNPPGTLTWLPAAEHLDLLGAPTAVAVQEQQLPCYVAEIDASLADTAAFCAAYDVAPEQSANCVVVEGKRGDEVTLAACHVLASDKADVNKAIRKHLGVRKLSFASMDTAVSHTGQEYGGISAVGVPAEWPILIDEAVAAAEWVIIGAGVRGSKIAIHGKDLATLPGAEVIALAQQG